MLGTVLLQVVSTIHKVQPMIKIGIIGYGSWVKAAYLPALKRDGRASIVALSARSESTLKLIKENFGNTVDIVPDFRDLLKSANIDALMIAVPDSMHAELISAAIDSGKAVFYEPPIAHTRKLVPDIIRKLIAAPQITHADLELALVPAVTQSALFIKQKLIGNVQSASIQLHSNWGPEPDQDINNIHRLSVWYVHVLNVLLNATPKRVLVLDGYGTPGRRQSQSMGFYDYDGIWGSFKVNIDSAEALAIQIEITGSEGEILINLLTGELKWRTKTNRNWEIKSFPALQPYADWPGMHESISAFLDAVESKKPSYANAEVVAKLHVIGMAAEESKDTGQWAEVKEF
jgi:predicted dehydrogenase